VHSKYTYAYVLILDELFDKAKDEVALLVCFLFDHSVYLKTNFKLNNFYELSPIEIGFIFTILWFIISFQNPLIKN
jgi:hypothetical protein